MVTAWPSESAANGWTVTVGPLVTRGCGFAPAAPATATGRAAAAAVAAVMPTRMRGFMSPPLDARRRWRRYGGTAARGDDIGKVVVAEMGQKHPGGHGAGRLNRPCSDGRPGAERPGAGRRPVLPSYFLAVTVALPELRVKYLLPP